MSIPLGLAILCGSLLAFAIVNSIEIAVIGADRIRIHHLAEQGSRRAQAVRRLQNNGERFFAAIVFLQNVFSFLASVVGAVVAAEIADNAGAPAWVGFISAVIAIPVLTTEFGELTPKVLAAQASDRIALAMGLPAEAITRILGPVVLAVGYLPSLISRRVFGVRLETGPSVTEAELRMLIDISAEAGDVDEDEAELLDRVFHFGDRHVHEVMVPRTEIVWLPRAATIADFYQVYLQRSHSRFPVFEHYPDGVVGILGIKDVLAALAAGHADGTSQVEPLMRPAMLVPENKPIGDLFREMQESGVQMAVAVDEFGGTAGIVTLEQLIEEMVGPVRDELRPEEPEIRENVDGTIHVDGSLSVDEARDELGIPIPEGPYDTIAGFVLTQLGHIPIEGEELPFDGHSITVAEMKGPKIEMLRVAKA